jgi:hypothetical protein
MSRLWLSNDVVYWRCYWIMNSMPISAPFLQVGESIRGCYSREILEWYYGCWRCYTDHRCFLSSFLTCFQQRGIDSSLIKLTIANWWPSPLSLSTSVFIAMHSDPNVLDSTVFCFLEYQSIGALLTYTRKSMHEQQVKLLPASSIEPIQ